MFSVFEMCLSSGEAALLLIKEFLSTIEVHKHKHSDPTECASLCRSGNSLRGSVVTQQSQRD